MLWGAACRTYANQPYELEFKDVQDDGEVVGFCGSSSNVSYYWDYSWKTANVSTGDTTTYQIDANRLTSANDGIDTKPLNQQTKILVRYPKSELNDGEEHVLENKVEFTLTPADGVDSVQTTSAEASFTYSPIKFTVPTGTASFNKSESWPNTAVGGITFLESGESTQLGPCSVTTIATGYRYTLADNGDPDDPGSYGDPDHPYLVEVTDDYLFLRNERTNLELGAGDYELRTASLGQVTFYGYEPDKNKGKYDFVSRNAQCFTPIVIYGKFESGWVKLGTVTAVYPRFAFESSYPGAEATDEWNEISLPSGCLGVRASTDATAAKVSLSLTIKPTLLPSERVLNWLETIEPSATTGRRTAYLDNVGSGRAVASDGTSIMNQYWDDTNKNYRPRIIELDAAQYGSTITHNQVSKALSDLELRSSVKKTGRYTNDVAKKRVQIYYTVAAYEEAYFLGDGEKDASILWKSGYLEPQESGTFYDLLPLGVEPDTSTIKVSIYRDGSNNLTPYDDEGSEGSLIESVETVTNWDGTGRTMLIVHVKNPEHLISYKNDTYPIANSGFYLSFTAYYPWDSLQDYGKRIVNLAAYMTDNDEIFNGNPDEGYLYDGQVYMTDVNKDGVSGEGAPETVLYGNNVLNLNVQTTAEASLTKRVRGGDTLTWVDGVLDGTVDLNAADEYQYRLRYATGEGTSGHNIILYDALEEYVPEAGSPDEGGASWQGEFKTIDVSQIVSKGANPKVYYSTVSGLDIPSNTDLSDTSIWSPDLPANPADVRAIAIDCTTTADQQPFVLEENQSLVALVTMQVPDDESFVGAQTAKDAHAFNQVYCAGIIKNKNGDVTSDQPIHNEYTKVGLIQPLTDISVTKEWLVSADTEVPSAVTVRLLAGDSPVLDGEENEMSAELAADSEWTYTFEELPKYDENGDLIEYTVAEDVPDGYQYDIEGSMTEGYTISNSPMEPVSQPIEVTKKMVGREFQSGDTFTFKIEAQDDAPLPDGVSAEGTLTIEPEEGSEASVPFGSASFEAAGTYTYTITEVKGDDPDIAYSNATVTATVEVTRGADGKLSAQITYDESTTPASFTNVYYAPTTLALQAKKVLEGRTLAEGEFAFELLDSEGEVLQTAKNETDGSITFEPIEYGLADTGKETTYTIREVAGNLENVTYDTAKISVTVTVEADDEGNLTAVATYDPEKAEFTNTYTPPASNASSDPNTSSKKSAGSGYTRAPSTGDTTPIALLVLVPIAAGVLLAVANRKRKE